MVILIAGLTTIPSEIYEAAAIGEASSITNFFHNYPNAQAHYKHVHTFRYNWYNQGV